MTKLNMWESLNKECANRLYQAIQEQEYYDTMEGDWKHGDNREASIFRKLSKSSQIEYAYLSALLLANELMKLSFEEFIRCYDYLETEELEENLITPLNEHLGGN